MSKPTSAHISADTAQQVTFGRALARAIRATTALKRACTLAKEAA